MKFLINFQTNGGYGVKEVEADSIDQARENFKSLMEAISDGSYQNYKVISISRLQ